MSSEHPGKENRPFSLGRRPGKPRKIRLNFTEGLQTIKDFGTKQDLADEEVFALCNKFSTASIR